MSSPIYYRKERSSWYVRIPLGDATYKRINLHTENRKDAERAAASMLAAVRGGSDANILWQDLVDKYKKMHFPQLKEGTRETYLGSITALTRVFYDKHVRRITSCDIDRFVDARIAAGAARSGARADLKVMSSIMGRAIIWDLIDVNPVKKYLAQNADKVAIGDPRERYLFREEEAEVLELCEQYANESDKGPEARMTLLAAITVTIDTGTRIGELMEMRWDWINWKRGEVHLPKEVTKNKKSRWVPLLPRTYELLKWRRGRETSEWVFPNDRRDGPRVDFDRALDAFVAGPVAAAGIPKFGWHDLRRTCGCRLLQDHKMPMERVSLWLGHSSVIVTEKSYAFLRVDDLHKSVGTSDWLNAAE